MQVIRRLLVTDAEADRMIVAVTDAEGRMLWVEGDRALRSRAESMHFVAWIFQYLKDKSQPSLVIMELEKVHS
jgi:hypothetical protein